MPKIVDHDQRRGAIAEATWRIVASKGLHGAGVREIADEAGCSTGVLAHYFRDKDELLLYALRLAWDRAAQRMERRRLEAHGFGALRSVLLEALPLDEERRAEWRVWLSFWGRATADEALAAEHQARYGAWRHVVQDLLLASQDEGSISLETNTEKAADTIVALVDGIGIQATLEPQYLTPERQTDLVDGVLSGLKT